MKAWRVEDAFGLEHLRLVDVPDPTPGPGQVLVQVGACSLNQRDLMMVTGKYNPRQALPLVPLSDGAGTVVEVGAGVTTVKPGDVVCGLFAQGWQAGPPTREKTARTLGGPLDGMLRERVVLDEAGVVVAPAHLDVVQAATLPCAGLTAWSALVGGGLSAGQTVLVLGTGGVSTFALQFARLHGATVIATTSSPAKVARTLALGATHVVDTTAVPEWGKRVKELTGGRGVDHVVEVGGAGTLAQSLRAVAPGGTVSVIGVLAGAEQAVNVVPILMQGLRLQGVFVGHRDGFVAMGRALVASSLVPVVDKVFGFAEAPAAFAHLAAGGHVGKLVVRVGQG